MPLSTTAPPFLSPSPPWQTSAWARGILFGFLYFLGESYSGYFATWNTAQIYFWLPTGVYLGALICTPPRHWLAIVLGTWVGDITFNALGDPWGFLEMTIAHAGNSLAAVLGAWAVRRFVSPHPRLESVRELFLIILFGGALVLPICATIGTLVLETRVTSQSPSEWWINWYCTDMLGTILVTPGMIVWLNRPRAETVALHRSRRLEAGLLVCGQLVAMVLSFTLRWPAQTESLYIAFPFVIWSAVRFGPRGATSTILLTAMVAHWFNAFGIGAIGSSSLSPTQKIVEMLFSIGVFSFAGLVPAITFEALGRAEKRVRESERRREVAINAAASALWEWDLATDLVWISPRFRQLLGYRPEETRDHHSVIWNQVHPDDLEALLATFKAQSQTGAEPIDLDLRYPNADGEYRWFNLRGGALASGSGAVRHLAGSLVEITERKALESRVQQADKLAVIGQLAGGVAHDFNNILAAMIMNIELLQLEHHQPETVESLDELHRLSKRASRLTEQLLMFARRRPMTLAPLHLGGTIEELVQLVRRLIPESILLEVVSDNQLWVNADHAMLDQVLLNLCLNARDALPQGGRLRLVTRTAALTDHVPPAPAAGDATTVRRGSFACIEVSDNGIGMSPDVLSHIFEPFFTTKEPGKGTGLGLASSGGIIHQHSGWIEAASTLGEGTTFSIYLPLGSPPPNPVLSPPPFTAQPGRETILLVEDETSVRAATGNILRTLGYHVLTAENAADARQRLAEHPGSIQLLFTDTIMPGETDGLSLGRELRQADPALRVLLTSGYSQQIITGSHLADEGFTFLAKPFDRAQLAHAIREALDRRLAP